MAQRLPSVDANGRLINNNPPLDDQLPKFRPLPKPSIFTISFPSTRDELVFTIGGVTPIQAFKINARYEVVFAPISLVSASQLADAQTGINAFLEGTTVGSVGIPASGGTAIIENRSLATQDGWFWATAVNPAGIRSEPAGPLRNPLTAGFDSRIPADVGSPTISMKAVTRFDRPVVQLDVSATVPGQGLGISLVNVGNGGTGYTNAAVTVTPVDGFGSGAVLVPSILGGRITRIDVADPGNGYTQPPDLAITGDGTGATATCVLTNSGSFDGYQLYFEDYFQNPALVEGRFISTTPSHTPGSPLISSFVMEPDSPPGHNVNVYFVSLSKTGTRRSDPTGAPVVALPSGITA